MKQALSHLLNDLLSAILFLAVYLTTANLTAAAAVAITVGLAQIVVQQFAGRRIWPMQWISLAVVIVLSAASIAMQSPRFVMLKPSLGHFAVAAAMLKRGWMSRYLPEVAQRYLPVDAAVIAGYAWAGLMAALGLANILIALYAPFAIWVWFISVGAIGAKVAAFALQYAVFRAIIRRARSRAEDAGIGAAARPSATLFGVVAGLILLVSSGGACAVGFQQAGAPDPEGQPLELDIWYPSDAPATSRPLGLFQQVVAADAPISGSQLPLVVISHGTGGGAETHYDTALALAEAGFIAVAVTHTGDNWRDHAYSFTARNFIERARHIKLTIDYMLTAWSSRDRVAAERIGAFGHSAGGFTVLVAIGGNPELARLGAYCREHPDDWGCQRALARGPSGEQPAPAWSMTSGSRRRSSPHPRPATRLPSPVSRRWRRRCSSGRLKAIGSRPTGGARTTSKRTCLHRQSRTLCRAPIISRSSPRAVRHSRSECPTSARIRRVSIGPPSIATSTLRWSGFSGSNWTGDRTGGARP
jgi:intracellular septation protein A